MNVVNVMVVMQIRIVLANVLEQLKKIVRVNVVERQKTAQTGSMMLVDMNLHHG